MSRTRLSADLSFGRSVVSPSPVEASFAGGGVSLRLFALLFSNAFSISVPMLFVLLNPRPDGVAAILPSSCASGSSSCEFRRNFRGGGTDTPTSPLRARIRCRILWEKIMVLATCPKVFLLLRLTSLFSTDDLTLSSLAIDSVVFFCTSLASVCTTWPLRVKNCVMIFSRLIVGRNASTASISEREIVKSSDTVTAVVVSSRTPVLEVRHVSPKWLPSR
mmetsp:Transcript_48823/g.137472  ORF Transcript_48823/g.137472 Transcript_48823/m.137472 type:complete len:219 (+) Transcript_48823:1105-1761(+)